MGLLGQTAHIRYVENLPAHCDPNTRADALVYVRGDGLFFSSAVDTWVRHTITNEAIFELLKDFLIPGANIGFDTSDDDNTITVSASSNAEEVFSLVEDFFVEGENIEFSIDEGSNKITISSTARESDYLDDGEIIFGTDGDFSTDDEEGGDSLSLGETSSTAYRGDRGKIAYDHSQTAHNKAFVGLPNVDNTSDISKPVSTAQAAADTAILTTLRAGVDPAGDTLFKLYALIVAINSIIGSGSPDGNSVVDTVAEILAIFNSYPEGADLVTALAGKQATLVSGTNIKTVNGNSLLGAGNVAISGGGGSPGGGEANIQTNVSGDFAGSDNLTFDDSNQLLTVRGTGYGSGKRARILAGGTDNFEEMAIAAGGSSVMHLTGGRGIQIDMLKFILNCPTFLQESSDAAATNKTFYLSTDTDKPSWKDGAGVSHTLY